MGLLGSNTFLSCSSTFPTSQGYLQFSPPQSDSSFSSKRPVLDSNPMSFFFPLLNLNISTPSHFHCTGSGVHLLLLVQFYSLYLPHLHKLKGSPPVVHFSHLRVAHCVITAFLLPCPANAGHPKSSNTSLPTRSLPCSSLLITVQRLIGKTFLPNSFLFSASQGISVSWVFLFLYPLLGMEVTPLGVILFCFVF